MLMGAGRSVEARGKKLVGQQNKIGHEKFQSLESNQTARLSPVWYGLDFLGTPAAPARLRDFPRRFSAAARRNEIRRRKPSF